MNSMQLESSNLDKLKLHLNPIDIELHLSIAKSKARYLQFAVPLNQLVLYRSNLLYTQ